MSRRLEQRVVYGDGWTDEWEPITELDGRRIDLWGKTDSEVTAFVRKWNRDAKARGDRTQLRSVDEEEG